MSETTTTERGLESPADVSSEDRLKGDREAFNRVIDKYKDAPRRDDSVEAPQPDNGQPQQPQASSTKTPAKKQEPTSERQAAEEFLRLKTGSPQSVIDSMNDEQLLSWAEDRRTREAGVDATFSRAATAEKELERLRAEAPAEQEEPTEPTSEDAIAEVTKILNDELALTDEGYAALDKLIDMRVAPMKAELEQHHQRAQRESVERTVGLVEKTRGELVERFGELADDTKFGSILEDMGRLEDSPQFGRSERAPEEWLPDLMSAIARSHGLAETDTDQVAAARQAAQEELHDRASGNVQTGGRTAPAPGESREDVDRAAYDAIRKKHSQGRWAVG